MKYCKKCVMPETRPGIKFDEEGVCYACLAAERKKKTDWDGRMKELQQLCDRHRNSNGDYYDCMIAVSGGKDSHFQVYMLKEVMKMNPLLVSVDNLSWTQTGRDNFMNIRDAFDCDCISLNLSPNTARKMMKKAFVKFGSPTWFWDRAVYAYPIRMAINMGIKLIVYGENINYEYGGAQTEETPSALAQINNDVVKSYDWNTWLEEDEITMKQLNSCVYPKEEEIKKAGLEPVYLSYFVPWDGYRNYEKAKEYGFKSLDDTGEWKREGYIEGYDQIDAIGYLVHPWLKYPKFGHARATDVGSYWIRNGRLSREKAIQLVRDHDHKLDPRALKDFIDFLGITEEEFWKVVEKFWNRELFRKVDGRWELKEPIWEQS
ncbi:MAG: N-acetyl sugar amidotransferase [Candidatus Omnitrophica bacterium]|nr:N-acetyl sugar amidotransferase [Candidatus Omnitrophota bacterium]